MHGKDLFEYAVIRVVPMVEREEFMNVGVVLFCAKQRFLEMNYELNRDRICALSPKVDQEELANYLNAFEQICEGGAEAGPIGRLPIAERFRWLTATRSTVVQTGKVHPGFCADAGKMLLRLYTQMVK